MGLDQFLEARQYVSKNDWKDNEPVPNADFSIIQPMTMPGVIDPDGFSGITMEYNAAQWRKANAIQRWMNDELAGGDMENCQSYPIDSDKLDQLRQDCKAVLSARTQGTQHVERVAEERGLYPMEGFFFGSYDFDEWYFNDLEYTVAVIDRLDKAGALNPESDVTFTYRAWW
jgi:hypothetical protein